MGAYQHRTYGPRWNPGGLLTPAIKWLLIVNTAVFLLQTLIQLFGGLAWYRLFLEWFGLVPMASVRGLRIWQPLTYLFLHGGLWHLLINMLVLWMFGRDIEQTWGQRRFFHYYFLTGVGAGLINVGIKMIFYPAGSQEQMIVTIGASGAIYGILMAAALLFPDRQVWLIPFPVTLPMRVYVAIIGAIAFFSSLGSGDNVSHISHLAGMLVGYIYLRRGSFLYRVRNRYSDWQRKRAYRRFEVYKRRHQSEDPPNRPDDWVN